MQKQFKTIFYNSIKQFFNSEQNSKLYLINSNSPGTFIIKELVSNDEKINIHNFDISSSVTKSFEPFFSSIKEWYHSDPDNYKIVKKLAYPAHYDQFISLLNRKITKRDEPLLIEEVFYEQTLIINLLIDLFLMTFQNRKTIFYLTNAQNISSSTADFIKRVLDKKDIKIAFVLIYTENTGEKIYPIEKLISYSYEKRRGNKTFVETLKTIDTLDIQIETLNISNVSLQQLFDEYYFSVTLMAYEDSIIIAKEILIQLKKINYHTNTASKNEYQEFLTSYSLVLCYAGKYREAYIYAHTLLTLSHESYSIHYKIQANLILGVSEYYSNSYNSALTFAQIALKIAEKHNLSRFIVISNLLFFYIKTSQKDISLFHNLSEMLIEQKWNNIAALTLTSGGYLYALLKDPNYSLEQILGYFKSGFNKARKSKNLYRISIAYHVLANIYSFQNNFKKSISLLKKSIIIKKNNNFPLSRINNSIGYNSFIVGDYRKSYSYFKTVIKLLTTTKNFTEVCSSLYNIGKIYFFLDQLDKAINLFEDMIQIMDLLNIEDLPFQPRVSVYSLLGISHYKSGNILIAWNYMQKIQYLPDFKEANNKSSLYWFFKFMVNDEEELNEFYMNNVMNDAITESPQFIIYACYFFGSFYEARADKEKADYYYQIGIETSKLYNVTSYFYYHILSKFDHTLQIPDYPNLTRFSFDIKTVFEFVKEEHNLNQLHKKIKEFDFISRFQNIIIKNDTKSNLIQETLLLIQSLFPYDTIMLHIAPDEYYSNHSECKEKLNESKKLFQTLEPQQNKIIFFTAKDCKTLGLSNDAQSLQYLSFYALEKKVISLAMISKEKHPEVNEDEVDVLQIFLTQLYSALELIAVRDALLQSAKTDTLTGLNNRMEIEKIMDTEYKRILRYPKKPKSVFSLLFIDLDNFKYYNDTFGHHVGDMILVEFSKTLRLAVRDVDHVARLGGDEFIILLPETPKTHAESVAKRIYTLLLEQDYFSSNLNKILGFVPFIPDSNIISCSIGITDVLPVKNRTVSDFLITADKALYVSKNNGKKRYTVL